MTGGAKLLGLAAAFLVLTLTFAGQPARAANSDPAAAQIEAFDASLIGIMKEGPALGLQGRYRKLEPVVARTFDTPTMIRFAVGAGWSGFTAAQQQALTDAFQRLTTASYAHNFKSYSGERFDLDPNVQTRGPDKVVQTRLAPTSGAPVAILYRMRQSGGTWKVIDVYYGAISQLTTRRSDFAATVAKGGAPALIEHLNALVDKQMK